jgi:hypothetical protein
LDDDNPTHSLSGLVGLMDEQISKGPEESTRAKLQNGFRKHKNLHSRQEATLAISLLHSSRYESRHNARLLDGFAWHCGSSSQHRSTNRLASHELRHPSRIGPTGLRDGERL